MEAMNDGGVDDESVSADGRTNLSRKSLAF